MDKIENARVQEHAKDLERVNRYLRCKVAKLRKESDIEGATAAILTAFCMLLFVPAVMFLVCLFLDGNPVENGFIAHWCKEHHQAYRE